MKCAMTGREIPKDLQGITGMRSGFVIPPLSQSRLSISGDPGAGKSTLLNSNPHLIILDAERGGDTTADPQALRFTPPPGTDPAALDQAYLTFVDKLIARRRKGATDIQMVCIDSIDELISIFQAALCLREGVQDVGDACGGRGKGYSRVGESIFGMLDKVYRAGMGWAIIAHRKTKTIQVGKEEVQLTGLSVSDSYKALIFRKCEHMLAVEHGLEKTKGPDVVKKVGGREIRKPGKIEMRKVRKLKTGEGGLEVGSGKNDLKVRVPLPEEIILPKLGGWGVLDEAYRGAVDTLTKGNDDE
jgi:hypothetical protein